MSMYEPKQPYEVVIPAGETVYVCRCGRTSTPPLCDGTHNQLQGVEPAVFSADPGRPKSVWVCGCGASDKLPLCDGTHNTLG